MLVVPGGAGDAWPQAALMAELKGWRLIAINRPGSGLSDGVDHGQVDLRQLAVKTIRTVADAFELERFPIICNSMGGLWSAWFALRQPERVSQMVQMGCPAMALDTSAPFFMRLIGVPGINRLVAPMMQPNDPEAGLEMLKFQGSYPEDIARLPKVMGEAAYAFWQLPTYLGTWKTLVNAVTTLAGGRAKYQLGEAQLRQLQVPTQFIWGDNDVFGDLQVGRRVAEIVPNAQLQEMHCGHLPFMDKPEETGRIIQEFLGQEKAESQPAMAAAG